MAHPDFPALVAPELDPASIRRGVRVQTRVFYADSKPGSIATVVRHWTTYNGTWVRCNYGKNLSGKSLLKTMHSSALALAVAV